MTSADMNLMHASALNARTGFGSVLRAEWTKFWSIRFTIWTLIASAAISIGLGALFIYAHLDFWSGMTEAERASIDPIHESFIGLWFAGLLGFAVIGALTMTSEYSSGTIGATFAAVPRRLQVLGAKAIVVGTVTLVVATVTAVITFFVAQPILAVESLDVSVHDDGVLFAVLGGGIYATGAALAGLALGTIIRRTATTLVALTAIFFLASIIGQPWSEVTKFLPHAAGMALMSSIDHPDLLSPLEGLFVLAGWVVAGLLVAGFLLQRRDAIS